MTVCKIVKKAPGTRPARRELVLAIRAPDVPTDIAVLRARFGLSEAVAALVAELAGLPAGAAAR